MKILLLVSAVIVLIGIITAFAFRSRSKFETILSYGPFTVKAETVSNRKLDSNLRMGSETTIRYSVWHKGNVIQFPAVLQNNTGYSHMPEDCYGPKSREQVEIINRLGNAFNQRLSAGEFQSHFTQF